MTDTTSRETTPGTRSGPPGGGAEPARGRGWALLATSLGFGVVQLDVSVVNVAIAPIGAELGGDVAALQWVVNAYTVAFAALILSAGALGDRVGAKRVFLAGFALFTAASVACGLAPGLAALVAARAVQGVGAAALVPCSLSVLNHAYPERGARARAVGLWAAGASVALSAGPLVGGVLTETLGWRSIFVINAPLGLAGIALTWRYAGETSRTRGRRPDLPGQLAAVVCLLATAWATISVGRDGPGLPVLAGFGLAAAAGVGFVLLEATRPAPMLPLSLFRSRTFSASVLIGLVVNVAFYGLIFVFSLYFQAGRHFSALATGAAFAPMTCAVLAANLLAARLSARLGARRVVLVGATGMALGLVGLLGVDADSGLVRLVGPLAVVGFGLGLLVPAMTAELLGSVEPARSGLASGALNTARQAGSVLGVALFGSLAAAHLVAGLRRGLLIALAAALAAAALTAALDRGGRGAPAQPPT